MEKCKLCDRIFNDDEHFVYCEINQCPMKSEDSILDMLLEDEVNVDGDR